MNNINFEGVDLFGSKCLEFIDLAQDSIRQTIEFRRKSKLSISRYSAVKRELKELKKVLLCYSQSQLLTNN